MSPYTIDTNFSFEKGIGSEEKSTELLTESHLRTQIMYIEQIALSSAKIDPTQSGTNSELRGRYLQGYKLGSRMTPAQA